MVNPQSERSDNKESERRLEGAETKLVLEALQTLTEDEQSLDKIYEMARFSLETVTHLTEYEDEKANRVMTAVTFLSALAAVVFSAFIDKFPPRSFLGLFPLGLFVSAIVVLVYISFVVYCLQVVLGAALTLSAVRPQFNIPSTWKSSGTTGPPSSFLFFDKILEAGGQNWGKAFATGTPAQLKREYTRNCIVESFLIAQKIRHKLRPLQKGIKYFWLSSFTLLVFLVSSIAALALVRAPGSAATTTSAQTDSSAATAAPLVPKLDATEGKNSHLPAVSPGRSSAIPARAADNALPEQQDGAK